MMDQRSATLYRYLGIFQRNCLKAQDAVIRGDKVAAQVYATKIKSALSFCRANGVSPI